ncbi:5' nucleotidase, NT5C type [Neobacillus sp. SM06]|uniref:5' nucleotidase, NT5C type n=1 Tax=Neobacillus sp. SM06 TaxID=3422492 RepID=UPI003D2D2F3A
MRKKFGIDIDGTVTSPASMIPFINKDFGLDITLDDITQYDLNPLVNVSEAEFAAWFYKNEPLIYAKSPLAQGASTVLSKWQKVHDLIFISARGSHLLEVTKKWFDEHNLGFHHIELIGTHDKVETAKKHNVALFLEDKHDNAVMIHEECQIPVLLFDTPYNRDPLPNGVVRIYNWNEADEWVKKWLG